MFLNLPMTVLPVLHHTVESETLANSIQVTMHSLQELCWGMETVVHNTVWSLFSQSRWGRDKKPYSHLNGSGERPVQGARREAVMRPLPIRGPRQAFPREHLLVCSDH